MDNTKTEVDCMNCEHLIIARETGFFTYCEMADRNMFMVNPPWCPLKDREREEE